MDAVGVGDRAHTLGDDEHRAVVHVLAQGLAQRGIGRKVERGERVVEYDELRVADECAGDRQPLTLATGEVRAPLGDLRGHAMLGLVDERARLCDRERVGDLLFTGVRITVEQVAFHVSGEQPCALLHVGDACAQVMLAHVAHVDAVDEHPPQLASWNRIASAAILSLIHI